MTVESLSGLRESASGTVWNRSNIGRGGYRHSDYHPSKDWEYIVGNYSSRNLSNEQDKLSAISGIAKMMLDATKTNKTVFIKENKPFAEA